jgi:hypothetical protein
MWGVEDTSPSVSVATVGETVEGEVVMIQFTDRNWINLWIEAKIALAWLTAY